MAYWLFFVESWLLDTTADCLMAFHIVLSRYLYFLSWHWWVGVITCQMISKSKNGIETRSYYYDLIKSKQDKNRARERRLLHFPHCGTKMLYVKISLSDRTDWWTDRIYFFWVRKKLSNFSLIVLFFFKNLSPPSSSYSLLSSPPPPLSSFFFFFRTWVC